MKIQRDEMLISVVEHAFEELLKKGNPQSILHLLKNPDQGPFGPHMAAIYAMRLPFRKIQGNEAVTDEMMSESVKGFLASFSDEYWEMWLYAAHLLLNSEKGWRKRKWIEKYPSSLKEHKLEDEVLAPWIKEVYKKVFAICDRHTITRTLQDNDWLIRDMHRDLRRNVMTHSRWDERVSDYGITPDSLECLGDEKSACILRRVALDVFASEHEHAIWKLEWEIERLEGVRQWIEESKAPDVKDTLAGTLKETEKRLEEARSKLATLRKQENRQ